MSWLAFPMDELAIFYREWDTRAPGARRSLPRARALATALDLQAGRPVLTVVGSKGKGTTATYASALLAAAGLRVCTVTSPSYRSDRERLRINGREISQARLATLAERLSAAIATLPPPAPGYLSPSGLFLLAGILHAADVEADVLVLEAGMGGRSDEVGLFPPDVLAITAVFAEHLSVLGDSPAEIAVEKAMVAGPSTRAVLTVPQSPDVAAALKEALPAHEIAVVAPDSAQGPLPAGVLQAPALLGCEAAERLLKLLGARLPSEEARTAVLASVRLPGRLSWHPLTLAGPEGAVAPDGGAVGEVLVDSAITGAGVGVALAAARERWGRIDHVLLCLPDHKDLAGAVAELADLPVTFVRLPLAHLRFETPLPAHWTVLAADDLTRVRLAALGSHLVALGTVYFTGRILDLLDANTAELFDAPE
jgi:folylpolyglutamate synthase/dihydropteroate synthase